VLAHRRRQRDGLLHRPDEMLLRQLHALGEGEMKAGDDRLLDLAAAESLGDLGQLSDVEASSVALAARQMDGPDLPPLGARRQVDEEDLVEAPLAQQLGWQRFDLVRRRYHEYRGRLLLQPGEHRSE